MAALEIPISSANPHFEQENEIFGLNFIFEFEWIEREVFWLLHILDESRSPIALGIKLQPAWPLYTHHLGLKSIGFMLLPSKLGQPLNRQSLKENFVLVAHETL